MSHNVILKPRFQQMAQFGPDHCGLCGVHGKSEQGKLIPQYKEGKNKGPPMFCFFLLPCDLLQEGMFRWEKKGSPQLQQAHCHNEVDHSAKYLLLNPLGTLEYC